MQWQIPLGPIANHKQDEIIGKNLAFDELPSMSPGGSPLEHQEHQVCLVVGEVWAIVQGGSKAFSLHQDQPLLATTSAVALLGLRHRHAREPMRLLLKRLQLRK